MFHSKHRKLSVWCISLVVAAYVSVAPAISNIDGTSAPKDYSSCVFDAIAVDIGADDVSSLEQQCRREFPSTSNATWLAWTDVGQCYDRQEAKAGNRVAAIALFKACSEYFL